MSNFNQFSFKPFLNLGLAELKFVEPTIVKEKVMPLLLKHQNVICKAHTGTGKTFAFCLTILNNVLCKFKQQTLSLVSMIITSFKINATIFFKKIKYL